MTTHLPDYVAIENEIIKHQITASLPDAVDRKFREIFGAAKTYWERNCAGNDPSDACVSVRVQTVDLSEHLAA